MTLPSVFLDLFLCFFGVGLFFGEVGDEAVGALHGEEHGGCAAYAAVAAGDHGFLVLEFGGGLVEFVAAVGRGDVFGCWGGGEGLLGSRELVRC